ncbi:uncharacterized protein LOC128293830 [Gossypium arboreum]|uniref:uncharacterized protein LOC128293830 n=1 Tax=Gossypium arboreum TaxID=29729 RepID=UPI0022F1BCAF|nr:uncharacterized protein LOC128293830 [Gossypium arboreum]
MKRHSKTDSKLYLKARRDKREKLTYQSNENFQQNVCRARVIVYFDAAYDQQHSRSVSGLLARNEKGDILASKMVTHFEIVTPFMAEAQAELQTVKLGIFMGLNKMDVKGDSKTFIKKCQSSKIDKSTIGATIRDIQSTKDRFQEMGFHFIPKTMNIYAHVIVKEALKRRESCYLVGGILEHVSQAMEKYRPRHSD